MAVSELEQIGFNQGVDYVRNIIVKAIDNPALDVIPSKMALQILLASLDMDDDL